MPNINKFSKSKRKDTKETRIYVVKPQYGGTSMEVGIFIPRENSNVTREGISIWMILPKDP